MGGVRCMFTVVLVVVVNVAVNVVVPVVLSLCFMSTAAANNKC